jgi:hypothetical protein
MIACVVPCSLLAVACGSDSGAGGSTDDAGGSGGGAGADAAAGRGGAAEDNTPKDQIGNDVFNEDEVKSYYLTFSDEEYAKLMDMSTLLLNQWTVNEERYSQASLKVGDKELPSVGVRFKGQFSLWGCVDYATGERMSRVEERYFGNIDVCQRFSMKLDFDKYDDAQRLDGLKKLNLHAMAADPSKVRERLGYSLYRDMDVLAPRAVHARVYINGKYDGLYAAVEQVDGRFTANRFPASGDGNLYKEIWPAEHITETDAVAALRTNDALTVRDVSDLLEFRDEVAASTEANFATKMAPYLDLDYLARYVVVNRAINDFDGVMSFYFGWGPPPANHNLYWYHDTESGQFSLIPWDLDKTFWYPEPNFWSDNAPNGLNIVPNWNVLTKSCDGYTCWFDNLDKSYNVMAIDCDPLLRLLRGEIYDRQKAVTEEFVAGPFSEENVRAKLEAWQAQMADAIEEDPLVDAAAWQTAVDDLLADLPNFHDNVTLMMSGLIEE